jgi:Zn-dependent protease with chaperone function
MIAVVLPGGFYLLSHEFRILPEMTQLAILAHEEGHFRYGHLEERRKWWLRKFFNRKGYQAMCRRQELEADSFAAKQGYGKYLVAYLRTLPDQKLNKGRHPSPSKRIEAIRE